jgi:hypothetical protein
MYNHQTDISLILRRLAAGVIPDIETPTKEDEEAFRGFVKPYLREQNWNVPFEELKLLAKSLSWLSYISISKRPGNGALLVRKFLQAPDSAEEMMFRCWRNIVADYSTRKLKFESDTLVPLSGLAYRWQSTATGRYLAGIWENDFLRSLGWQTSGPEKVISSYIAPSWSWSSTARSVHWILSGDNLTPHYRLDHVDCICDPSSPYGKVTSGYASLHVRLIRGTLLSYSEDGDYDSGRMFVETIHTSDTRARFSIDRCAAVRNLVGMSIYCMRLCKEELSKGSTYFERCLVLRCVNDNDHEYERIGFMTLEQPVDVWDLASYPEKIKIL